MKRYRYIIGVMAATGLLAASCTDFSDYNEAYTSGSAESHQTLWENIQANPQLTQFAELVRKAGFDKELSSSHYYTVWAPLDGTFSADYQRYAQVDSATLLYKFVQSHVANFGHTASGEVSEKVHTLNEKSFAFTGNGSYSYDFNELQTINQPSVNGVLHTINGSAEFLPNIYEYIFEAVGSDSVRNYFKQYEIETLNLSKSVEGAIVDGVQTYLDSVMDVSNNMTRRLRAYVEREDSNYTMILPTDKAYQDAYNRIRKYYAFGSKVAYQNLGSLDESVKSYAVDNAYLSDSLTRYAIARSLFFNNNATYNRWIRGEFNPRWPVDTIQTTSGVYYTNGPEVVRQVVDSVRMSNGVVWNVDTLLQHPWENWSPTINVSPTRSATRPKVPAGTPVTVRVNDNEVDTTKIGKSADGLYHGFSYLDLLVSSDYVKPQALFYIPGVLSTTYNMYVVMVPANIKIDSDVPAKQYKFQVEVSYSTADGSKIETKKMGNFVSDSTRVDTVFVGSVTFPTAYDEIPVSGSASVYPYVKIVSNRSTLSRKEWETVDNRLRIAAIILRPVEYDEYLKALYNKPEEE